MRGHAATHLDELRRSGKRASSRIDDGRDLHQKAFADLEKFAAVGCRDVGEQFELDGVWPERHQPDARTFLSRRDCLAKSRWMPSSAAWSCSPVVSYRKRS